MQQLVREYWLFYVGGYAEPSSFERCGRRRKPSHQDEGKRDASIQQLFEKHQAVEIRQAQIGKDEVERECPTEAQTVGASRCEINGVPLEAENTLEHITCAGIVVDDKHPRHPELRGSYARYGSGTGNRTPI